MEFLSLNSFIKGEDEWEPYDPEMAELLEQAVCRGDGILDLSLHDRSKPYVINFSAMTQTRYVRCIQTHYD